MSDRLNADAALARLKEGNARFVNNIRCLNTLVSQTDRETLLRGQAPYAIILACSDSRAPAEFVFDAGLGDLFVIRVAGNVTAPSLIGSVEFAAAKFGTRLVIVMGHTKCGAIEATIGAIRNPASGSLSSHIDDIVDRIRPGVLEVARRQGEVDEALIRDAVDANVHASAEQLRTSAVLQDLMADGLKVVEATYDLGSGQVTFRE